MISVITSTVRDSCINNIFENFDRQDWKEKELIIILNKNDMDRKLWEKRAKQNKNVKVYRVDEAKSLGYCLNYAIKKAKNKYIAKFDDDDYYGARYLTQAFEAMKRDERIAIVGKSVFYIYFQNENALHCLNWEGEGYTDKVAGATLFFKKDVWKQVNFRDRTYAEDYFFINDVIQKGYKVYSTNKKHFAVIRRDESEHTWKVTASEIKKDTIQIPFKGHFSSGIK
ncbi:glycosyltransferase [Bacillus alkalicellulosilyticus]|uniref:glycosyltransferase n=1 Tax=Alkalihalobacterium alkalicellulosilyticum TaxID=1912214 RepID=UPI0009972B09|nr:glycosyltransferase family A protein [Bacillus alkalicellulosilyticus]